MEGGRRRANGGEANNEPEKTRKQVGLCLGSLCLTSAPESAPFRLPIVTSRPGPAREIPAVIPPFLGLLGLWEGIVSQTFRKTDEFGAQVWSSRCRFRDDGGPSTRGAPYSSHPAPDTTRLSASSTPRDEKPPKERYILTIPSLWQICGFSVAVAIWLILVLLPETLQHPVVVAQVTDQATMIQA